MTQNTKIISSKQLKEMIDSRSDAVIPMVKAFSTKEADHFFEQDLSLIKKLKILQSAWDVFLVSAFISIPTIILPIAFGATLNQIEYYHNKYLDDSLHTVDQTAHSAGRGYSGFSYLIMYGHTLYKDVFQILWAKASPRIKWKLLNSTNIIIKDAVENNFHSRTGFSWLQGRASYDTLVFIANSTDPWLLTKVYGNRSLFTQRIENNNLKSHEKKSIGDIYWNITCFINHPKQSIRNKPEEFLSFLINRLKNYASLTSSEQKKWLALLNKALAYISPSDIKMKDKLIHLKGSITWKKGDSSGAIKEWSKIDDYHALESYEALALSDYFYSYDKKRKPPLTEAQCQTRGLIINHHIALREHDPEKRENAILLLNMRLMSLDPENKDEQPPLECSDNQRYQRQLEKNLDSLVDDLMKMLHDKKPTFWKKHTSQMMRELITHQLTPLKSHHMNYSKSDDHLMQVENVLKVILNDPGLKSGDKPYLSLLKDIQRTTHEIRSVRTIKIEHAAMSTDVQLESKYK